MCGFAGFSYGDDVLLKSIGKTLEDRAIDKEYFYCEKDLSFYHAHLKISDLDKNTDQPLCYKDTVIGLVGEIYNKSYLLSLCGISGGEDEYSELQVIGFCYEKFGKSFINYVNGEFSIFIFDRRRRKYFLYRDRWGTNNVYYRISGKNLYFASEVKSLIVESPKINKRAFVEFMTFQFCIAPNTIVDGIFTLRPGTYLEFGDSTMDIYDFSDYIYQEINNTIVDAIENSVIRRIPKFQDRIFMSLSGGPDSNLILFFLKKHYRGEIIAYSFFTDKNIEEIEFAKKNAELHSIKHLLIDMNNYTFSNLENDIYVHEGLVKLPNLGRILKEKYKEYADIKVEFGGDGKEELILGNNHYPYKKILSRYGYFESRNEIKHFDITQEFLNKEMFDYNLQMIDKLTLRNGIERRLPFTDYELLKFYKHKTYRLEAENYLKKYGINIVKGEFGYNLGMCFKYLYDEDLVKIENILMSAFKNRFDSLSKHI